MKFLMPHPVVAAVALCAKAIAPVTSSSAADVVVLDAQAMAPLVAPDAVVKKLAGGMKFIVCGVCKS